MKFLALVCILILANDATARVVKTTPLSNANNYFALQLLQQIYSEDSNVFFSPFSISTAFGMLYLGANGSTAEELREVLGYNAARIAKTDVGMQFEEVLREVSDYDKSKYELNVADKLVVQKDFAILETYKESLRMYFQSTIDSEDFAHNSNAAVNNINEWVKKQTHDKITKLLNELDPSTVLVILNAIYFKGIWQTKFLANQTKEEVFYNRGVDSVRTQMMKSKAKFNYTEIADLDSKLLELPYSGDDVSLYILLPNQNDGIKQLTTKLSNFSLVENGIKRLTEVEVDVSFPKFKISSEYSLRSQLSRLGMKHAFSDADLSGIDGKKDLVVSDVIHKAVVEVNEEGSEAAAATAIVIVRTSGVINEQIVFNANHPFAFFIEIIGME